MTVVLASQQFLRAVEVVRRQGRRLTNSSPRRAPAERHQHFLDSIVDPATLSPEQLTMIHERGEAMVAEYEARHRA